MIKYSKKQLIEGIRMADRVVLSRAITYAESQKPEHRALLNEVIEELAREKKETFRIGITGVPGVGKSTFIEAFGQFLIAKGHKVAVLTIDPSSKQSGGSILGDKTRMPQLAVDQNAYIRPSPAGLSLGGVARKTREAMILCESAGFDIIIVETVGVGQSETAVSEMVDAFLLLMLSGAGDELQGIKKGIMETADIIAINKCDGDNVRKSQEAQMEYRRAVQMFPKKFNAWTTKVLTTSALENTGMDDIWEEFESFRNLSLSNGHFDANRRQQLITWFDGELKYLLEYVFLNTEGIKSELNEVREKVKSGDLFPFAAAEELIWQFLKRKF